MDVDDIARPGNRNELFQRIVDEHGLCFESGQVFVDVPSDDLGRADVAHLANVSDESISSLGVISDRKRKFERLCRSNEVISAEL